MVKFKLQENGDMCFRKGLSGKSSREKTLFDILISLIF